jgi:hypothetical protein
MTDKAAAESANWRLAHEWAQGLDLTYAGVALADCVTYPLLSTFGRIVLQELEADATPEPAA